MKRALFESLFLLLNQEWDLTTGEVPFSQYAKAIFQSLFQAVFQLNWAPGPLTEDVLNHL